MFRWKKVMEAVCRMANLFKRISSENFLVTVSEISLHSS